MIEKNKIIAFVDGLVTNEKDLTDEMYENGELYDENGDWQMIFGVTTLPEFRKRGIAANLIEKVICDSKKQNRRGLVLTCKDILVNYYKKFGFKDEGVTEKSNHGGITWHQMRLTF